MSARTQILASIRSHLAGCASAAPPAHRVPARGRPADVVATFIAEAERAQATVARLSSIAAIPQAVAAYLADHNIPATIRAAPHPVLDTVAWAEQPLLTVTRGRAAEADLNGLSVAVAGVAETGTLVLCSGPGSPTTLNFLPDNHLVVVRSADLVGAYEDALARIGEIYGPGTLPRAVNWVTGPSRTADIEQTLLMGAHGPRRLHILVVDDG